MKFIILLILFISGCTTVAKPSGAGSSKRQPAECAGDCCGNSSYNYPKEQLEDSSAIQDRARILASLVCTAGDGSHFKLPDALFGFVAQGFRITRLDPSYKFIGKDGARNFDLTLANGASSLNQTYFKCVETH